MAEDKKVPSDEGKTKQKSSDGTVSGNDGQKSSEAHSQVPEHLRGKSESELLSMYQNLEKKLGEQSSEVSEAREQKKQVELLLGAIWSDPKRVETAQSWVNTYLGGDTKTKESDDDTGDSAKKVDDTASRNTDDTRQAMIDQHLTSFYTKHGIDQLDANERKQEQVKIATAFAEMLDPSGKKSVTQLLNEIPLTKLPKVLDYAYVLANRDNLRKSSQGDLEREVNRQASLGSLSSERDSSGNIRLTAKQQEIAKKMGVSAEKYAKNLERIEKEQAQV